MRINRIILMVLAVVVLMWGWQPPQPAMAWGSGYRNHTGYRHYGHRRYRHHGHHRYRHQYRHYGQHRYYGQHKYRYQHRSGYYGRSYTDNSLAAGWDYLEKGYSRDALNSFSTAAQANPSSGTAKVGYALATADLGRLDRGVWAMRRALRIDPDSLHYVNGKTGLRYKVEHLVDRYEKFDHYRIEDADAYFMLAALYFLLDDHETSKEYVEKADDGTTSTRNLQQLILNYG